MSTVTVIGFVDHQDWTVDDLDQLPNDGLRYELADGVLLVSPAPTPLHQNVVFQLAKILDAVCPPHLRVFVAPLEFRPTIRRAFQPDLMVARVEDIGRNHLLRPPVLAVEVLSPGTALVDLNLKRKAYAQSEIESYWIVDPDREELIAHERDGDEYLESGRASGDNELELAVPFPVTVTPSALML